MEGDTSPSIAAPAATFAKPFVRCKPFHFCPVVFLISQGLCSMVPVFDISLIGTLTAIWAAAKVIFGTIGKGLDWIAKKALSALIASKFWASAFFLGLAVSVVACFNGILSAASSAILSSASASLSFDSETFTIMSYFFNLSSLVSFLNFLLALLLSYLALTRVWFLFNAMRFLFRTITGAWKT